MSKLDLSLLDHVQEIAVIMETDKSQQAIGVHHSKMCFRHKEHTYVYKELSEEAVENMRKKLTRLYGEDTKRTFIKNMTVAFGRIGYMITLSIYKDLK